MPPHHVSTLEDYWVWAEQLIARAGAWFEDWVLRVRPLEDSHRPEIWTGLVIEKQPVHFANGSTLYILEVLDDHLATTKYSFHYQTGGGELIWRKDNHPGHFGPSPSPHIHRNPAHPNLAEPYKAVDLEEALEQATEGLGQHFGR